MGWAVLTYAGVILAGCCARVLIEGDVADSEGALIGLTTHVFPPVLAGVVIAAVLSAIMSTADSQLLVCSSTVAHDLSHTDDARRALRRGRVSVVVISLLAMVAAVSVDETIFDTVLFAWSGLGAAFGPLVLVRVLVGPVPTGAVLASMWLGFLVSAVWFLTPLKAATGLYELVPAFIAAWVPAWFGATALRRPRRS
jgi:sodium/proline symporter